MARRAPDGRMRRAGTRGQAGADRARTSGLRGRRCGRGGGAGGGQAAWEAGQSAPCSRAGPRSSRLRCSSIGQGGRESSHSVGRPRSSAQAPRQSGIQMWGFSPSRRSVGDTPNIDPATRAPSGLPEPRQMCASTGGYGCKALKPLRCGPRRKRCPGRVLWAKLRLARLVRGLTAMT